MRPKCSFVGCGRTFPCYAKLEDHMNVHLGLKPHMCDICDKSYPSRKAMNAHKRTHEPKAFKCAGCGFLFAYRYKLARHVQSCQRRLVCEECGKLFLRKGHYDNHVARRHPPKAEKPVKCEKCEATFLSTRSCRSHIRIVHEGLRVSCAGCGRKYSYRSSLNEHQTKCSALK